MSGACQHERRGGWPGAFKRGDHVGWNSEAGRVRGVLVKKIVSDVRFSSLILRPSRAVPPWQTPADR